MTKDFSKFESEITAKFAEIESVMSCRVTAGDMERIRQAYSLAEHKHRGQWRKSGEPYILHPLAVARILAVELKLGANPVIAALLHDVVEDTDCTNSDIEELFGNDVAFLVRVVTKSKNAPLSGSKQVDNFRQLLVSINYDIRALLVKLADRLHNMRTLSSMRPDKQMKIAGETDYFYAPLARRLGLYFVAIELENLSMRYRCPRVWNIISNFIDADRRHTAARINAFTSHVDNLLSGNGIDAKIDVVYRTPYSLWRKMNIYEKDFRHVDHKKYVQIVYDVPEGTTAKTLALRIYSLLTDNYREQPGSLRNYIDSPLDNGYRSLHVKLLSHDTGRWVELHIMSREMLLHSQLGCVADRTEASVKRWIEDFRTTLQEIANTPGDFMSGVEQSFYRTGITVFTPDGKALSLPQGATPLDVAFEVHTDIGSHAHYAYINGSIASVLTELRSGDVVEIITANRIMAKHTWLEAAHTSKARRAVRRLLAKRPQLPFALCPHCKPLPGEEVIGFKPKKSAEGEDAGNGEETKITVHLRDCKHAIRDASRRGDAIVTVDFKPIEGINYDVPIRVKAINRANLLGDMTSAVAGDVNIEMKTLTIDLDDEIVTCVITVSVSSLEQLDQVFVRLRAVESVEEVTRVVER